MPYLDSILASADRYVLLAFHWINHVSGCRYSDEIGACSTWHDVYSFALHYPTAMVFIVGFPTFFVLVAALRYLISFARARYDLWRTDHLWGRFMRPYEAYRAGLLVPRGFLLGDLWRGMLLPLRVKGEAGVLTFGGARSGKTAGIVIPNCLSCRWQVIVDWAGEITSVCLPVWRAMNIHVVVANPCRLLTQHPWNLPVHRFNPVAGINANMPGFGGKCRSLARSLFINLGQGDPFWIESGVAMVDFCARHVIERLGDQATLIHVYRAVLGGLSNQEQFFASMAKSDDKFIRDAGNRLSALVSKAGRTAAGIVQQIESQLAWMADDLFEESLSGHDLDFDDLRARGRGQRGCIVVFILPLDKAAACAAWKKTCLNALTLAMIDEIPDQRILLTVDDAAVFGNWDFLEESMSMLTKYRIQMHLVYQSMGQPVALFGEKFNAMMGNAHVKNFVGVNDQMTARYLSETLGKGHDGNDVLSAEQLGRLRPGAQISILRGQRPIMVENRPYYNRALMRRRVNQNPYHGNTPRLPALWPLWVLKGAATGVLATSRPTTRQVVLMVAIGSSFFWWRSAWALF